jgi:hypothetical protein
MLLEDYSRWILSLALIAGGLAGYGQPSCGGGSNNYGFFYAHECFENICSTGTSCEHDACRCGTQGGWLEYCVGQQYCGQYPGCFTC